MLQKTKHILSVFSALGIAALLGFIYGSSHARPNDISLIPLLQTGKTITGQTITYPNGGEVQITAAIVTLQPGAQTGWHLHDVPLFGYILEGEIIVDYGPLESRTYSKGDALIEARNQPHNGVNTGTKPVKILSLFMGIKNHPNTQRVKNPEKTLRP